MTRLRIATRASRLALAQSGWVARRIEARLGVATELVPLRTSGDRLADVSLSRVGGKGLFVKELEEALLAGGADLAVHSAKDLPARLPPGLALVAFPERADARDALVSDARFRALDALPPGARVGTGSARRSAQLLAWRPDLEVVPLRGNVPTRIERLAKPAPGTPGLDAVILACAGLERLGLAGRIDERVDPVRLLPAVGQGVLALEARAGGTLGGELAAAVGDPEAARVVTAERTLLERLQGDCNVPLAGFAEPMAGGRLRLRALVARPDGTRVVRAEAEDADPVALGATVAGMLLDRGAAAILEALRAGAAPP
jgi:hydroxymethylbilane synthase